MSQVKLSDLVRQFIAENYLPFYMDNNKHNEQIVTIRKKPEGFANSVGFVSDRRGMVCVPLVPEPGSGSGWLDPARPTFFDELRQRLKYEASK